jgi:hypothetical protein
VARLLLRLVGRVAGGPPRQQEARHRQVPPWDWWVPGHHLPAQTVQFLKGYQWAGKLDSGETFMKKNYKVKKEVGMTIGKCITTMFWYNHAGPVSQDRFQNNDISSNVYNKSA